MAEFLIRGDNRLLPRGTFNLEDTVVFRGTRADDLLLAGGGEIESTFLGTRGDDFYAVSPDVDEEFWPLMIVDYAASPSGVRVDLTYDGGTRTVVDEFGETRSLRVLGRAEDGFGDVDLFGASPTGIFSSIFEVRGSPFDDRILGAGAKVFAGAGDDFVRSGASYGWISGGTGADVLVSGAGEDVLNPDVERFESDPAGPRDGDRDVIRITRCDLGDFTDQVLARAFEEDVDQIRFADAVRGGADFRVFHEARSVEQIGYLQQAADRADLRNTVLQIDWNGDGFGKGDLDLADYFMVVVDADLTLRDGYLLT